MKVRLTSPLRQIGRVLPAGVILADAPDTLMIRLVREGKAEWVDPPAERTGTPPGPSSLPFSDRRKRKAGDAR